MVATLRSNLLLEEPLLPFLAELLSSSDPHPDTLFRHTIWMYIYCISISILYIYVFWHFIWHSFWHILWNSFWHSMWHLFWHTFWHICWHSFWHQFWHFWYYVWHLFRHSLWHGHCRTSTASAKSQWGPAVPTKIWREEGRKKGGREGRKEVSKEGRREVTLVKSRHPHLAGGEKYLNISHPSTAKANVNVRFTQASVVCCHEAAIATTDFPASPWCEVSASLKVATYTI